MKKSNCLKVILTLTVVLLLVFGANNTVLGYGDGGGGGGGGSDGSGGEAASGGSASEQITKLTDEEILVLWAPMVGRHPTPSAGTYTTRELMALRQRILQDEQRAWQLEAAIDRGLCATVEGFDWLGQQAQFVLAFVPGVGWVTSIGLGAARGGANAYRDGKSEGEVLANTLAAGAASGIIKKLSPLGADKALKTATGAWRTLVNTSSKRAAGRAIDVFQNNGIKYVAIKGVEREAKAALGGALSSLASNSTKQVPHKETPPVYTPPGKTPPVTKHE